MESDTVKIRIDYTHIWNQSPFLIIGKIDNKPIFVDPTGNKEKVFTNKISLKPGPHQLQIELKNKFKDDQQTHIDINSIWIDGQYINDKIYNMSTEYFDHYGARKLMINGTWKFNFTTPIYEWLINFI